MKIAVVGEFEPSAAEGMAIVARSLARAFAIAGAEVLDLTSLAERNWAPIAVFSAIRRLRTAKSDITYYIPKSGLTFASVARAYVLARATEGSVVLGCLQADGRAIPLVRRVPPDAVIVPSSRLSAALGHCGVTADVVELGVDRSIFRPDGALDRGKWPDRPGLRVLHVGHLTRRRNLGVFVELARRGHNCLVVASPSSTPDPELVEELGTAGVTIVREHVSDIAAVYRCADVYAFPVNDSRGCIESPLSVLEACGCGTPVVSTPFGGIPELAERNAGIRVVPERNFADVIDALDKFPERAASPVADWQEVALAHTEVFNRVLDRTRAARLVVLLGVDGSGKSTQASLLTAAATERGLNAVTVWSRWNPLLLGPVMRMLKARALQTTSDPASAYRTSRSLKRRLFRSAMARRAWMWVASLDHALRTVPRIAVARRSATLVVADRYLQDTLVDMGANFGTAAPKPKAFFRLFPQPDRTILLDVPERIAMARKNDVPSLEYLVERRSLYLSLARREGWPVVDASRDPSVVHAEISKLVWSRE